MRTNSPHSLIRLPLNNTKQQYYALRGKSAYYGKSKG